MHENKNYDFSAILETIEPFLAVREDKDNPLEKMEIVIDKDIFIASVETMSPTDKQVYLQQVTARFRQICAIMVDLHANVPSGSVQFNSQVSMLARVDADIIAEALSILGRVQPQVIRGPAPAPGGG